MPKEIVRDEFYRPLNPDGDSVNSFIQVGWSRDGFVQVATIAPDGRIAPWDNLQQKHVIDSAGHDPGWFVSLDRDGINQLIRHLRKARDAAFGRDE